MAGISYGAIVPEHCKEIQEHHIEHLQKNKSQTK